jgi:hypothetical protein
MVHSAMVNGQFIDDLDYYSDIEFILDSPIISDLSNY